MKAEHLGLQDNRRTLEVIRVCLKCEKKKKKEMMFGCFKNKK